MLGGKRRRKKNAPPPTSSPPSDQSPHPDRSILPTPSGRPPAAPLDVDHARLGGCRRRRRRRRGSRSRLRHRGRGFQLRRRAGRKRARPQRLDRILQLAPLRRQRVHGRVGDLQGGPRPAQAPALDSPGRAAGCKGRPRVRRGGLGARWQAAPGGDRRLLGSVQDGPEKVDVDLAERGMGGSWEGCEGGGGRGDDGGGRRRWGGPPGVALPPPSLSSLKRTRTGIWKPLNAPPACWAHFWAVWRTVPLCVRG